MYHFVSFEEVQRDFRHVNITAVRVEALRFKRERYAPLDNLNLDSDEDVDAWIRASSHSGTPPQASTPTEM